MVSSLGLEESFQGSHQAFLISLLSSAIHIIPCSVPFPCSPMGEGTRLSEDGFSLPSLDLVEERDFEDSRESSEIEWWVLP